MAAWCRAGGRSERMLIASEWSKVLRVSRRAAMAAVLAVLLAASAARAAAPEGSRLGFVQLGFEPPRPPAVPVLGAYVVSGWEPDRQRLQRQSQPREAKIGAFHRGGRRKRPA